LLLLMARTAKYQVPAASEPIVVLRRVGSSITVLRSSAALLVPYRTLYLARFVNGVPLVLVVGAVQVTVAEPDPQVQVSV
jgi:hypothetical protein